MPVQKLVLGVGIERRMVEGARMDPWAIIRAQLASQPAMRDDRVEIGRALAPRRAEPFPRHTAAQLEVVTPQYALAQLDATAARGASLAHLEASSSTSRALVGVEGTGAALARVDRTLTPPDRIDGIVKNAAGMVETRRNIDVLADLAADVQRTIDVWA